MQKLALELEPIPTKRQAVLGEVGRTNYEDRLKLSLPPGVKRQAVFPDAAKLHHVKAWRGTRSRQGEVVWLKPGQTSDADTA
jgi:hypothetical protein